MSCPKAPSRRIANVSLPKPARKTWYYGVAGTPFEINANKSQLEVRSALSARLHLPICVLELNEERLAVLNIRSFHEKILDNEFIADCACCGDGLAEGVLPIVPELANLCRSCEWNCMPLCSRCLRTSGLEIHCALCLGDDWSICDCDAEGLRHHFDLMDGGGREWCRNIVSLHDSIDALEQQHRDDQMGSSSDATHSMQGIDEVGGTRSVLTGRTTDCESPERPLDTLC